MPRRLRSPDASREPSPRRGARPLRIVAVLVVLLGAHVLLLGSESAAATAADGVAAADGGTPATGSSGARADAPAPPDADWLWPVDGPRSVVEPFRAPAHAYGPGHRGIDIAAAGDLRAPADGVVAFVGTVVDRPLLTIDHGNGLVTTFEPATTTLAPGAPVRRGDVVGTTSAGGHARPGTVHLGVRWNGVYINPMLLFGGVPRAVLLPCGAGAC